jgi:hypothetical protein
MISDFTLERYRLGELPEAERALIAHLSSSDPTVAQRLQQLEQDDASTLQSHPATRVGASILRRFEATVSPLRRFGSYRAPMLLAGAAAVLLVSGSFYLRQSQPDDTIRLKGNGPSLRLFRLGINGPERLSDGAAVQAHQMVQVAFDTAGATHLVVVSLDGSGKVTLHWPLDGNTAVPHGLKAVPTSFELDAAPEFERFFLVTANEPLVPSRIIAAAQYADAAAPLDLPMSQTQRSLLLRKEKSW